jgi:hypothetical protein
MDNACLSAMPSSGPTYHLPPGSPSPVVKEEHIEYGFIGKLQNLKWILDSSSGTKPGANVREILGDAAASRIELDALPLAEPNR